LVDSAGKDNALVTKLEAELAVCKAFSAKELNTLASEHILRTFGKRKRTVMSLLWPRTLVIPGASDGGDKARSNVVARLFGSATMKEVVTVVVDTVEVAMGLQGEGAADQAGEGKKEEEEKEEEEGGGHDVEPSDGLRLVETEEFAGFSGEGTAQPPVRKARANAAVIEDMDEDTIWERLMDPNAKDFDEFEERVGASDEEDEGDEGDDDVTGDANELERTGDEWSGGSDIDEDDQDDEESISAALPKATKTAKTATAKPASAKEKKSAPPETSQFLPSLMAGYVSGGDSDPDADWYKNNCQKKRGPPEKKERKNRMGQQARRALWEKKFGRHANHVQKQAEEEAEKKARRERREAERKKGKPVEGPLHPSWEAARKAKEKQAAVAAAMAKPAGKKITFD